MVAHPTHRLLLALRSRGQPDHRSLALEGLPIQQDDGDSPERVRHGRAGTAVFSVASERALGPLGKRLGRYVPRRIVHRRHLCAPVKCRMDARH